MKNIMLYLLSLKYFKYAELLNLFRNYPDFGNFSVEKVLELLQTMNGRLFPPSDEILREGEVWKLRIEEACGALGAEILTLDAPGFPDRLRHIPDPPLVLFVRGNPECLHMPQSLAVVGTRHPSEYGMRMSQLFGETLGRRGFIVVSGLARGCDTAAHQGSLEAGGGTVAVLPSEIDEIYPHQNQPLAHQILEQGGCLVSEYGVHQVFRTRIEKGAVPPHRYFIHRNRLQSGLSQGLVVIESQNHGGTMHTVRYAFQQNHRPVACLDLSGWAYEHCRLAEGNRTLIRSGKAKALGNLEALDEFLSQFVVVSN